MWDTYSCLHSAIIQREHRILSSIHGVMDWTIKFRIQNLDDKIRRKIHKKVIVTAATTKISYYKVGKEESKLRETKVDLIRDF